ncbi:lipocalin family protein [Mesonia sp.]|uniref:lipocalin family protein n=1 Tax=Mesonia sp. TaxID=1960830 RepID=UPI003F97CD8D
MKNILILLVIASSIWSCSNDDNNDNSPVIIPQEAILGKWSLLAREPDGIEGCEFATKVTFFENNQYYYYLSYGDDFSDCEVFEINGDWEYLGQNQFKLIFNDQTRVVVIEIYDDYERFKLYSLDDPDTIEFYVRGS